MPSSKLDPALNLLEKLSEGVVWIGPFEIPLIIVDEIAGDNGPAYGMFRSDEDFSITISRRNVSVVGLVNTLLHECLHAIIWVNNIWTGTYDEERMVTQISTGQTLLHQDNPWIAKWLVACLK